MSPSPQAAASERPTAVLSALAFFFVLTSYYIVRPVRDQLSGAVGSSQLPLFYAATFVAMLLLTPVFGAMVARFPRRRLLGWSYCFFIACLLAFVPAFLEQARIGARLLGVVFFVWVSVFNLFVVSLFWSFMADIVDSAQARRTFPLIALGGMAGAVFGPAVTSLLVGVLGVAPLLVVSALMLGAALLLLLQLSVRAGAGSAHGEAAIGGSLWAGVRELWSRPFLRWMAILMVLGDGIGTLAYALVADYAKAHLASSAARTAFYAHMDLAVNILGALQQLTLTRWLLVRRGAGWGLVLPALVNVALLLMVVGGGHATLSMLGVAVTPLVAVMMVMSRSFAYGMTKPAVDALYTRVPREARYKGKNFIETAIWRFGDLLVTSGVSGLGKLGVGVAGMALIGAIASSVSVWVAQRAGHSPDLLPEGEPETPDGRAASRVG
ncbi:translocase [Fulvimonas sp. R45]|uniref:NTP/NDP exchange transporter n=1 Tax=Fulvimonas sp. R45 TaxID=3045937 RepID=UPI00265F8797|nr:MFS transporter [Fulvimonas sp. R45]MDO1527658.1 translocase [Fulvimonas sp. R45]